MAQEGSAKKPDEMTVAELRARATELGISGRSSMNKADLVAAVEAADKPEKQSPKEDDGVIREDASDIAAPSIGPNTVIERQPPEERLNFDEISDVDAMGLDKRRQVAGKSYGPSVARQLTMYGIAIAVIAAVLIGGKIAVDELDTADANRTETAPWTGTQDPPEPIDFPRSPTN